MKRSTLRPLAAIGGGLVLSALIAAAVPVAIGALEEDGGPSLFLPAAGRKGTAVEIQRGKALLYALVQRLADYTGEKTYIVSEDPPDAMVSVPRTISALDLEAAKAILAEAGYSLSRESYRGEKVLWIQRLLVPARKQGALTRRDESGAGTEAESGLPRASGGLSLYERRDGEGGRFLLLFETASRKEAEDALLLLEDYRKSEKRLLREDHEER
jgi:hypothetical protein